MVEQIRSIKVEIDTNKQTKVFWDSDYESLEELFEAVTEWINDI